MSKVYDVSYSTITHPKCGLVYLWFAVKLGKKVGPNFATSKEAYFYARRLEATGA